MRIIDITRNVQDAPIYPGSEPVSVEETCPIESGYRSSTIVSGSHMGTHADAYKHFLPESNVGIDEMPLSHYYGPCRVIAVPAESLITCAMLQDKLAGAQRLVIHGGGLSYLTEEAARLIAESGICCVVTDAWSVGPLANEVNVHGILLRAGVGVV